MLDSLEGETITLNRVMNNIPEKPKRNILDYALYALEKQRFDKLTNSSKAMHIYLSRLLGKPVEVPDSLKEKLEKDLEKYKMRIFNRLDPYFSLKLIDPDYDAFSLSHKDFEALKTELSESDLPGLLTDIALPLLGLGYSASEIMSNNVKNNYINRLSEMSPTGRLHYASSYRLLFPSEKSLVNLDEVPNTIHLWVSNKTILSLFVLSANIARFDQTGLHLTFDDKLNQNKRPLERKF